eukprot:TRINITY_DN2299_c0_g1_i1.p1 TRINITY_DN2299_c0_g1~~TRINITY_DN2299_c0_g1_i1.p1  ORF type:complete len:448 (+),score=95.83 TRINITY_DN2299_c0_g1_i1:106-1449(+)
MSAAPRAISVESLNPVEREGFLTKQGGSWRNWKKRWMVLKGPCIYYFKTKKDKDLTGSITLTKDSVVKKDEKKKYCFSVSTSARTFFMFSETQIEQDEWMNSINQAIENLKKNPQSSPVNPQPPPENKTQVYNEEFERGAGHPGSKAKIHGETSRLKQAVKQIPFLQDSQSKPLEFWEIWQDSIPDDIETFKVSVSLDLNQVSWRCIGSQNKLIQKMVDFFWNVGAPEAEIDRLNDVGTLINPLVIGSWIDMSSKGGMDGGWYFPCEAPGIPLKLALEASDPGESMKKVNEWAVSHSFETVYAVGRDMGAAPPRQTHFEFVLSGEFETQLQVALSAYDAFGIPHPPEDAVNIIRSNPGGSLSLSVIVSSEGFVKLGIITPRPVAASLSQLCLLRDYGNLDLLDKFQKALDVDGVESVEYRYLVKGFGYGVYKEGFDIVFHYAIDKLA